MTAKHYTAPLTIAPAPLVLTSAEGPGSSDLSKPFRTIVLNAVADLYVGGPAVSTTSYGVKVPKGSTFSLDLKPDEIPFAVLASGSVSQPVLQVGAP